MLCNGYAVEDRYSGIGLGCHIDDYAFLLAPHTSHLKDCV